jgi:hypothetical protein
MVTLIQTLQETLNSKNLLLAVETKRIILKDVLQAYVLDFVLVSCTLNKTRKSGNITA